MLGMEGAEWKKAIFAVGGNEVKKCLVQLWKFSLDVTSASGGGSTLQKQEINMIKDRALTSPNPSSSPYSSHSKSSSFIKGNLGQVNTRKKTMPGNLQDIPKGAFQWVQNISLLVFCIDHSLQLVCPVKMASLGTLPFICLLFLLISSMFF